MDSQEANSSSTRRVKVDFLKPIKDKDTKWNHRKSLAWDTAFFTNPGVLDPEELFRSLKIGEKETELVNHKDLQNTLPCVSARPSFAWDNAFLTDPGVLDTEELSLVNNGFITNTELRKSTDSMMTTSQGSRFSVSSIEIDLFNDLRAYSTPNVKQKVTREIQPKLPDGKKRTKLYNKNVQPLSLIPKPKKTVLSSSSSSFISKSLTPTQAKPEKKCVASELGIKSRGKHKDHVLEEHSGSKSTIRSSNSHSAMKDLRSSSSGMKLPRPKMGFFDSENGEKENREPNAAESSIANTRGRLKSKLETSSPQNRTVLGQRKTTKVNWH